MRAPFRIGGQSPNVSKDTSNDSALIMTSSLERVLIFDTTLCNNAGKLNRPVPRADKLRVGRVLADLGVDVVEVGYPTASSDDWEAARAMVHEVQGPIICGSSSSDRTDVEQVAQALNDASRRRIRLFVRAGEKGSVNKGRTTENSIREGASVAREFFDDVQVSIGSTTRTELDFLAQIVQAAIEAGAGTVSVQDATGDTVPEEIAEVLRYLRANVRGIDGIRLSVHCKNDLGLAVANSLAAVVAGARQIECSIGYCGTTNGTCSLKDVVRALARRSAFFNVKTGIDLVRLNAAADLVSTVASLSPLSEAEAGNANGIESPSALRASEE